MTPTGSPKPKRVDARRVRTRMPAPAAVVGALGIAMAGLLVVLTPMVAAGADGILALVIGAVVGLAAGTTFFVTWWRRDPKRRRRTRR
ncbi:hypothetical protein [Asanoa hainanensis]|uniref:hypothetical protein n=1 Tax=Asanoa hainanensis TaxID=560556 RepID=UPI00117E96DA|nr:hypothetical protein [Asanoa hainanensis]